jgi:hypothetical protein
MPVTVSGDAAPDDERVTPPLVDVHVAVYEVIELPLSPGALNATTRVPLPRVTEGAAGTSGTAAGITAAEAGDVPPVPTSLVAVAVHVYVRPLVSPPTVTGDVAADPVPGAPPLLEVHDASYDVIALPPLSGAAIETEIRWSPRVTPGVAGADGTVAGTTGSDASDSGPCPTAVVARTVHVYVRPLVSPVTVIGDAVPVSVPWAPPLLEVHFAENDVIALPLSPPAVNATSIVALPRVTPVIVGGSGTAAGVVGSEGSEGLLVPTAFVAVIVQV